MHGRAGRPTAQRARDAAPRHPRRAAGRRSAASARSTPPRSAARRASSSSGSPPRPGRSPAWSARSSASVPDGVAVAPGVRSRTLPGAGLRRRYAGEARGARARASSSRPEGDLPDGACALDPMALGADHRQSASATRCSFARRGRGPAGASAASRTARIVFRVTDEGPGICAGRARGPPRLGARRPTAPATGSACRSCGRSTERLGGDGRARQPPGRRRRGGAALPGRGRGGCRSARPPPAGARPGRAAGAARRGQSDQPDGRLADAARAQCRGHRLRRRRRGARALRARGRSTSWSSTSRCRGSPAST